MQAGLRVTGRMWREPAGNRRPPLERAAMPRTPDKGVAGVCRMSIEQEIGAKRSDSLTVFLSYDRDD